MADRTTAQPSQPEDKGILNLLRGSHYIKIADTISISSKKSGGQSVKPSSTEVGHTPRQDPTRPEYSIFGGSAFTDNRGSR